MMRCWNHRRVRSKKETAPSPRCPLCEFIASGNKFVPDFFDAKNLSTFIVDLKPIPKCGSKVEAKV